MPPFREQLAVDFRRAADAAMAWGIRSMPLRLDEGKPHFSSGAERRKFIAACHRGYDKAQQFVFSLLKSQDPNLDDDSRVFQQLVMRRVIDTIAFVLLRTDSHVRRRLVLHSEVQPLDVAGAGAALEVANELNSESRQTFAVVNDLTTFIHVGDILRIDFRDGSPIVSILELKSGKVNQLLTQKLDELEHQPDALDRIKNDATIPAGYRKQALRMQRQRIRMQHVQEVLETDQGTDIRLEVPIQLVGPTRVAEDYDEELAECCNRARETGYAAITIDGCLHVGVATDSETADAFVGAQAQAWHAAFMHDTNAAAGLDEVRDLLSRTIEKSERFSPFPLLYRNLMGMSDRPFSTWRIGENNVDALVAGSLSAVVVFDLAGFMQLARSCGFKAELLTRAETQRHAPGRNTPPTWSKRALALTPPGGTPSIVLGGILARMVSELQRPLQVIEMLTPHPSGGAPHVPVNLANERVRT